MKKLLLFSFYLLFVSCKLTWTAEELAAINASKSLRSLDAKLSSNQSDFENIIIATELDDVMVYKSSEFQGITFNLTDIQFEADSAILLEGELIKLEEIANNLLTSSENDLLISGHTALAGTSDGRRYLSKNRANAVADYLEKLNVRDRSQLFTRGLGSQEPIASNDTSEAKALNRRVEITLIEK